MLGEGIYNKNEFGRKGRWSLNVVFVLLIVILLCNRVLILFTANQMVDSDQSFMWLGTRDYAEGHFYEPRFYGQDYNTFFEALVAAPIYKFGLPVYFAVPLATHLIFLFPLLFTTILLFAKGYRVAAILALCVFNCLPTGFDVMTSLPRGFVTGVFFSSFFVLSYLHPKTLRYIYLNTCMLVLGFFVNPNIVILGAPFMVFLLYHNYKNRAFYRAMIVAFLTFIPWYFVFDWFYDQHPEYVVYGLVHSFAPVYFFQNICNLDQCFAHISFFVEDNSWPLLVVLAIVLTTGIFCGKRDALITIVCFLLVLLFSMFTGKTREGSHWPYYSFSRMYIAVPFFIAIVPLLVKTETYTILITALLFTIPFCAYKLFVFNDAVNYHTNHLHAVGVRITSVNTIKDGISVYKKMNTDHASDHFIISNIFWLGPHLTYGGQVIDPEFPETEETTADHRYWVREANKNKIFKRFVILSINYDFDKLTEGKFPFKIKRIDNFGVFLIYDNQMKNSDFLNVMRTIEH